MNIQSKLVLAIATLLALPQMGLAGIQSSVSQSCNENKMARGSKCEANVGQGIKQDANVAVGLNKVGDKENFVVDGLAVAGTFGSLFGAAVTKEISPANASQNLLQSAKIYTFTPAAENLGRLVKGVEQKLLFVSYDLNNIPAWAPANVKKELEAFKAANPLAQNRVYVYGRLANQAANQWTEIATFTATDLKGLNLSDVKAKVTINPDAKVTIQLPAVIDQNGNLVTLPPVEADLARLN